MPLQARAALWRTIAAPSGEQLLTLYLALCMLVNGSVYLHIALLGARGEGYVW